MEVIHYKGHNLGSSSKAFELHQSKKLKELDEHLKEMYLRDKSLMASIDARFPFPVPPEEILAKVQAAMDAQTQCHNTMAPMTQ